ncbi:NAD(P)H-binding protein [Levilactobacillus parabrevis]|uniref:NAD(P)H-binding protein n=1 Tax=Levilactobacillus parabrevis TaxID=357278 RepID=UPI0021A50532|nr:NAD(P)H-binding protein [Levilactobacillus parabrevis]MCT4487724.1 NAD-dependent epimerase/dehydratase family protein [Levilactobacillus parabrevis]MCT4490712.1 NAD-dependent epimerase/dehydratase family protein [Levilactobacillus parabrevis]
MTKIMIVGAHGAMAQLVTERLLNETTATLTLFLRDASRLNQYAANDRVTLIDGDIKDTALVAKSMADADVVYSNLGGPDLADQMQSVLDAMTQTGKHRLIYISSLGAHHEVPGKFGAWNEQTIGAFLPGFRKTAELVVDSGVTYTEIRPAWLTNKDEVDYEKTQLGEDFKGTEVSRQSVADFVFKVITQPDTYQNASVGLDKPGTDGDQPSWF